MNNEMKEKIRKQLELREAVKLYCTHSSENPCSRCMSNIRGDVSGIRGNVSGIRGDVSDIRGNVSDIYGNVSGIYGDVSGIYGDVSGIYGDVSDIIKILKNEDLKAPTVILE